MKSFTKWVLIALIAAAIFALPSCKKGDMGVTIGAQVGPVYIALSFGGGQGAYYPYGNVPSGVNTSVAYIVSRPASQTSIAVFDQAGRFMGNVYCTGGDWQYYNDFFLYLRNWNYNSKPFAVLIRWDVKSINSPWTGQIIG